MQATIDLGAAWVARRAGVGLGEDRRVQTQYATMQQLSLAFYFVSVMVCACCVKFWMSICHESPHSA